MIMIIMTRLRTTCHSMSLSLPPSSTLSSPSPSSSSYTSGGDDAFDSGSYEDYDYCILYQPQEKYIVIRCITIYTLIKSENLNTKFIWKKAHVAQYDFPLKNLNCNLMFLKLSLNIDKLSFASHKHKIHLLLSINICKFIF